MNNLITQTVTDSIPFFYLDFDCCEENQNNSISPIHSEYTTIGTIVNQKCDVIIDLIRNFLINKFLTGKNSINNEGDTESMEKNYYTKKQIEYKNTVFEFKNDFMYYIYKDNSDDIYIAMNDFFDIVGYGDSLGEAEEDLYNTIYELWEIYVDEKDENLDNNAIILKKKLMDNIRKI